MSAAEVPSKDVYAANEPHRRSEKRALGVRRPKEAGLLLVFVGLMTTDVLAYRSPIDIFLGTGYSRSSVLIRVAVAFLTLAAAGILGATIAINGRDETAGTSINVAIAALAWLAPGVAMFLAQLESERQIASPPSGDVSFSGTLPETITQGAIYVASGLYIALDVRHRFYSSSTEKQGVWSPSSLQRLYFAGYGLLIVAAIAINIADLRSLLYSILGNYSEIDVLFVAGGATFLALASACRLGVAMARLRHGNAKYGVFDIAVSAGLWLTLGAAIFVSQAVSASQLINKLLPSLHPGIGHLIMRPLFFFAVYLISGGCLIFWAGHRPNYHYPSYPSLRGRHIEPKSDSSGKNND